MASRLGLREVPSLADTHDAPSIVAIPAADELLATPFSPGVPETADMASSQPSLEFLDVEAGVEYRATFHVKNKLPRPQRLRVAPLALAAGAGAGAGASAAALARLSPGGVPFSVRFSPPIGGVAPGMTVPVEVLFRMPGTRPPPPTPLARAAAAERRAALEGERARLAAARAGGAALAAVDAAIAAVEAAEGGARDAAAARAAEEAGPAPSYRAEVIVSSECGGELRIPLLARGPRATFSLGGVPLGGPLAFGPVVAGTVTTRTLRLTNDCRARGAIVSLQMLSEEEAAASAAGASRTPRPHAAPATFRVRPMRVALGPAGEGSGEAARPSGTCVTPPPPRAEKFNARAPLFSSPSPPARFIKPLLPPSGALF